MKPIIQPVERDLIRRELTADKFLRPTNKAHNEIYVITAHNSPHVDFGDDFHRIFPINPAFGI